VQIEPQQESAGVKLRHDAFVYGSDDEFATRMCRFLEEGMADGAAAVAVTTPSNWAVLREALGGRGAGVHFTDRDSFYTSPPRALAMHDATLRHHLGKGAPSVRIVAEVQFGPTPTDWKTWTAYEAIANRAFADQPAWIVCPYDERVLPRDVLDGAWRTHPEVVSGDRHVSSLYDDAAAVVRSLTPEHEPLLPLKPLAAAPDAHAFRDVLAAELRVAELPPPRALDMLVAANEVFVNAEKHGGGATLVRTGEVDGRFVCEISDGGRGLDDPLAGYLPPKPDQGRGAGLWVARQLVSHVEVLPSPLGLVVRLWL
jgi:anti-sigma regulatory factor (Ser/Thr protein kinase)